MDHAGCDTCRHWQKLTGAWGACHRHAPPAQIAPYSERLDALQSVAIWPGTMAHEWCGEHTGPANGDRGRVVYPLPRRPVAGETPAPAATGVADEQT